MFIWTNFVEFLVMVIVTLSQLYGGNLGLAIITLSLAVRLALLPITVRLARQAQERQAALAALEPEIQQLRRRYRTNPERLTKELTRLYSRHGYSLFDRSGILGALVQLPIFAGLYSAINQGVANGGAFLWIANLARPDFAITILVALLTFLAGAANPQLPQGTRTLYAILPALMMILVLWQLAAGLGLYWTVSSTVNVLQTMMLRRKAGEPDR